MIACGAFFFSKISSIYRIAETVGSEDTEDSSLMGSPELKMPAKAKKGSLFGTFFFSA